MTLAIVVPPCRLPFAAAVAHASILAERWQQTVRIGINTGQPSMKTRANFTHRVDMWDDAGENIVEHLAGVEDFEVAEATYRAALKRWPRAVITLRASTRVIHDSRKEPSDVSDDRPRRDGAREFRCL